jgi:hypothetical protein
MTEYDNDIINVERDRDALARLVQPILIKDMVNYNETTHTTHYILGLDSLTSRSLLEEKLAKEKSSRYNIIDVNHELQQPCGEGREPWPHKTLQHTLAIERLALPVTRRSLAQKLCILPLIVIVLYFFYIVARLF